MDNFNAKPDSPPSLDTNETSTHAAPKRPASRSREHVERAKAIRQCLEFFDVDQKVHWRLEDSAFIYLFICVFCVFFAGIHNSQGLGEEARFILWKSHSTRVQVFNERKGNTFTFAWWYLLHAILNCAFHRENWLKTSFSSSWHTMNWTTMIQSLRLSRSMTQMEPGLWTLIS